MNAIGTNLFVTDYQFMTLSVIDTTTDVMALFAGIPQSVGTNDGLGLSASFNYPAGLCTDPQNSDVMYITGIFVAFTFFLFV